jgi:uncharacterized membrane protein YraQ (UPF0718 family)
MDWKKEGKILLIMSLVFIGFFYLPLGIPRFDNAVFEALYLTKWYAQEHVILCLLPAFFIAGAISVFISQQSVMKYLGAGAKKIVSYGVASVSGGILAVCSCTVLPLFSGIYKMGAGLGPAVTFLYSGPAINVMAVVLTANVLGIELGIARAVGAVVFSIVIGLIMALIYRKEENDKKINAVQMPEEEGGRPLWQNGVFFFSMVGVLIFANWAEGDPNAVWWNVIHDIKWYLTASFAFVLALSLFLWFELDKKKILISSIPVIAIALIFREQPIIPFVAGILAISFITASEEGEGESWFSATWDFTKQIMPLLFYGVLIAGFALGRPGSEGIVPAEWISALVGDNSVFSNLFASVVGAFMYFATLTEIPILQGLIGNGMAKGPALTLLLAGPALSLPNMLVIRSIMGTKKTLVFVGLVIVMSSATGLIYGSIFG